jgi:hypothetical protein
MNRVLIEKLIVVPLGNFLAFHETLNFISDSQDPTTDEAEFSLHAHILFL